MPRPKSELTGKAPKKLSVRLSEEQHLAYLRLGGSGWLREAVNRELERAGGKASQISARSTRELPPRAGSSA